MKKIEAYIKPYHSNAAVDALKVIGITDIMVLSEVKQLGVRGTVEFFRGAEYPVDHAPRVKLEFFCQDILAEQAAAAIMNVINKEDKPAGKITISKVDEVRDAATRPGGAGTRPGRESLFAACKL